MFKKVLIANRGEIACRVIRTCQRLGIKTAAVYSEADAGALHVKMADEAVSIGPPPPKDSYLKGARIVRAAKKLKADAVHPGYGLLSENPDFAKAVEDAGIAFVGPTAKVMEQMGNKVAARRAAKSAGVPVVPGTERTVSDRSALKHARLIGFPLMVKAADGGGGMGIRVVEREADLAAALARARVQAQGAFGSDRIYLERCILQAAHIEVQVVGDKHGNVIHLFERDCSLQRRNQKIIEETPSAKLTPEVRATLLGSAVRLAKKIGYTNAGTIEYLFDTETGEFYFLEMNTRIQVEHPVTEMTIGVDLVELQLLAAAGEPLPLRQEDVRQVGAAVEARIYPEDPQTLLPTSGTVTALALPEGDDMRVDTALYQGYSVSAYYEPLMAKVIARGVDRRAATANLLKALSGVRTDGVVNNVPLIQRVLAHAAFKDATYTTSFLESYLRDPQTGMGKETIAAIALAMAMAAATPRRPVVSKWLTFGRRMQMVNRISNGAP